MKRILALSIIFLSTSIYAQSKFSAANLKIKICPYVEKYLSAELTVKICGKKAEVLSLPVLPKIQETDAKSVRLLDEAKIGKAIADKAIREKYDYLFLAELFQVVRGEKANDNVIARWMNSLSQGGSREGVYQAIVLDNIYGGMENRDYPVNDGVIRFTLEYMPRFLGVKTSAQGLEAVNFYRLKREVTTMSLSMMDALASQSIEDFYRWYSVFSAELAQKYPSALNNPLRANADYQAHYKWVQTVPYQHAKSEVMVKLQLVFNSLY